MKTEISNKNLTATTDTETLPQLQGSEKQIAWAEEIREDKEIGVAEMFFGDVRFPLASLIAQVSRAFRRKFGDDAADLYLYLLHKGELIGEEGELTEKSTSERREAIKGFLCKRWEAIKSQKVKASWWIDRRNQGPGELIAEALEGFGN